MTASKIEKIVVLLKLKFNREIMTSNLSVILKKYTVPVLFFVVGIIMLAVGVSSGQGLAFNLASVMMFIAGALSVLFSTGNFKSKMVYILGGAAGIAALITLFLSWKSVNDTSNYNTNYAECKAISIQNLQDIRYIQKAHAEKTGIYLSSWDSLVEFAKNGTVPFLESVGSVPSRPIDMHENKFLYTGNPPIDNDMTELEAYRLSKWTEGPNFYEFKNFRRDTVQRSLMDVKFGTKSYIDNREKLGFYTFSPDSLPVIPYTHGKDVWGIETKDSINIGGVNFPAIRVEGNIPFAETQGKNNNKELMYFGSITLNELGGSWEE